MAQFRNTVQKEQVYSSLLELANHPTADEVYDYVRVNHPKISRATVYRVLNQLADTGAVRRIGVPGSAAHFDHRLFAHNHVRCIRCGRVVDVDSGPEVNIDCSKFSAPGFRVMGYSLIFDGICGQCCEK